MECSIATYLKLQGIRTYALPFDYIISNLSIISDLVSNDFKDFFNVTKHNIVNPNYDADGPNTIFINNIYPSLSFPHHNLNNNIVIDNFKRRIERFYNILQSKEKILFMHLFYQNESHNENVTKFVNTFKNKYNGLNYKLITIWIVYGDAEYWKSYINNHNNVDSYEIHIKLTNLNKKYDYLSEILKKYELDLKKINDPNTNSRY